MKAYKIEVYVLDYDGVGEEGIKYHLENTKYPNWCIAPNVISIQEADVGEWSDDHPLNKHDSFTEEYNKLFPKQQVITMGKKEESPRLRFYTYQQNSSMNCSGCEGKVGVGDTIITGNLVGSGSRPFLILCGECKKTMIEGLSK